MLNVLFSLHFITTLHYTLDNRIIQIQHSVLRKRHLHTGRERERSCVVWRTLLCILKVTLPFSLPPHIFKTAKWRMVIYPTESINSTGESAVHRSGVQSQSEWLCTMGFLWLVIQRSSTDVNSLVFTSVSSSLLATEAGEETMNLHFQWLYCDFIWSCRHQPVIDF